jgi:hypothetical protein
VSLDMKGVSALAEKMIVIKKLCGDGWVIDDDG